MEYSVFISAVVILTMLPIMECKLSRALVKSRRLIFLLAGGILLTAGGLNSAQAATDCAAQSLIPQTECECLVSLYNSTDGPNWTDSATNNWNQDNDLSGWTGVIIRDGFVRELDRDGQNLTGTIPDLSALSYLEKLSLGNNQLSGTIPDLSALTRLEGLYLPNNQLSGEIPDLTSLTQLEILRLNNNQLTGTIPANLNTLTRLRLLHLERNQFSGEIPNFSSLTNLTQLKLFENQLSGTIPDLSALTRLDTLWLQSNQLSGEVPAHLTNMTTLDANGGLDLGYNAFIASDTDVITFLEEKDPDWSDTQTVAPTDIAVTVLSGDSVRISWMPIAYTDDGGWYQVKYASISGGPYTEAAGTTPDKTSDTYDVEGLDPGTYYFVVETHTPAHGTQQNDLISDLSEEVTASVSGYPEVNVLSPDDTDIPDGGSFDFGAVIVGESVIRTFTIESTGATALAVANAVIPDGFSLTGTFPENIAAGADAGFQIQVDTTVEGNLSGELSFDTNDSDENPYNFTISATVNPAPEPEIGVSESGTDIPDGGSLRFGTTTVGTPISKTFTVNNRGDAVLTLSNLQLPAGFSRVGDFPDEIPAGGSDSFQIQLNAAAEGEFNGEIQFETNDEDENPYHFTISGTVNPAPEPEIEVSDNGADIPNNGSADFGTTTINTPVLKTFTIRNNGTAVLNLGDLQIPQGFSLSGEFPATVAVGGTGSFQIRLDAGTDGVFEGTLSFGTDDSDENPYAFTIRGTVTPEPEIAVSDEGADVPSGSSVNFGSTPFGTPLTKTFTLSNTGKAALSLSHFTLPEGFGLSDEFPDTVAAGGTEDFQIQLLADVEGTFSGILRFENNDRDENPYLFTIRGTVTPAAAPEIEVLFGSTGLSNGGTADFGSTAADKPISKTFTIRNTGDADLNLSNLQIPEGFSRVGTFPASVPAGESDDFKIQLDADAEGDFAGTVRFDTNDSDENPFSFTVSGTVNPKTEPEIEVSDEDGDVEDGGRADFGTTMVGSPVIKDFTIRNTGSAALKVSDLELPEGFSLSGEFPERISAGNSKKFQIQLDAETAGDFKGTLRFDTNDENEDPYNFTLNGEVNPLPVPEIEVLEGSRSIPDGGRSDFGSVGVGEPVVKTFTIRNTGAGSLSLGQPDLPTGFSLVGAFPRTIAAGDTDDFQIRLNAVVSGDFSGILRFTTNDTNENPYNFTLTAKVNPEPEPEIQVSDNGADVPDGGWVNIGSTFTGFPVSKTFVVKNAGTAVLTLEYPEIPEGFSLVGEFPDSVEAGEIADFQVQLDAEQMGEFTGNLMFETNDADESPYQFTLTGTVNPEPEPEIEVLDDGTEILNGETVSFGTATTGTPVRKTFTVRNTGMDFLILKSPELPEGFSLIGTFPESVAPFGTDEFEIQLDADTDGEFTGELQFETNDTDENPFNFTLTGAVNPEPEPEIEIWDEATEVFNNGTVRFGNTVVESPIIKTFSVRNTGTAELVLGALNLSPGFSLIGTFPQTVAVSGTDAFQIQLDASAEGEFAGYIGIETNDSDESFFSISISGKVQPKPEPEIEIICDGDDVPNGGTVYWGGTATGGLIKTFTIRNIGAADLNLSEFQLSQGFSMPGEFPETVTAEGEDRFEIQLDANFAGRFEGMLSFHTNDSDENPYEIKLIGSLENVAPMITGQHPVSTAEDTPLTIRLNDLMVADPDNSYPYDFTLAIHEGENYRLAGIAAGVQNTTSMAWGDVDGDGDADLITGNDGQPNRIYLNNGTADPFKGVNGKDITTTVYHTKSLVLGDIDGDGDLDLIAGNDGINHLYVNNGTDDPFNGVTGTDITADVYHTRSVVLGDVDGDGDLDLIAGNEGQTNRLYLNNGTENPFENVVGSDITADAYQTRSVVLGDVDSDGDLDLIASNDGEPNRVYLNNGTEEPFKDVAGTDITADANHTRSVVLGDADGDGDLDLIAGNYGEPSRVYLNNGTEIPFDGVAGINITEDAYHTTAVIPGDIDGDGDLDLIAGNDGEPNRVYLNNGTADPFSGISGTDITADIRQTRALVLKDIDGDGDLDVIAGNAGEPSRVYLNNGTDDPFTLPGRNIPAGDYHTSSVCLGDVDQDGDLDLIAGNDNGTPNYWYPNKGRTLLFNARENLGSAADIQDTPMLMLGDVDGDGDLDVIAGNDGVNRLYLNNGTAEPFQGAIGTDISTDIHHTRSLALGDIDGDGDADLIAGNYGEISRIYLNNGTETPFDRVTGKNISSDTYHTRSLVLADIDGDGHLDIIMGNDGEPNRLYLNNGTEKPFDRVDGADITSDAHFTHSVVLGDIDGDGDLDLITGNNGEPNRLYLNNGTENPFSGVTGTDITPDAYHTRSVVLGDVDGDGDLDLMAGNEGEPNRLYLNNGTGNPFDGVWGISITADAHHTRSVALGDVDGDGDLDLIAGNDGESTRIYLNNGTENSFSGVIGIDTDRLADYTIIPATDFTGELAVPVTVNDGTNDSNLFYLNVRVTPVNDPPVITGQNPLTTNHQPFRTTEGTPLILSLNDLTVKDPDNAFPEDFSLLLYEGENYTADGSAVIPAEGFSGVFTVPIRVYDGTDASNLFHLNIQVIRENIHPVISDQKGLYTDEGASLTLTLNDLVVTDPDNVFPEDFSLTVLDGENYTQSDHTVTPAEDFTGELAVPVKVNDGIADSDVFYLRIIVSSDADNDGMPNIWEREMGLEPLFDDADQDADGDGYSNLEEYLAGTDPRDPDSKPSAGPSANAGPDQIADEGTTVMLQGTVSGSSEEETFEYLWTQTDDSIPVTLSDPADPNAVFVTPPVTAEGAELTFELRVTNAQGFESSDQVTVSIKDNGITAFPDDVLSFYMGDGNYMGIKVISGGTLVSLYVVDIETIGDTADKPAHLVYGLPDIQIRLFPDSDTAVVRFYLPESASAEGRWYLYSLANGWSDLAENAVFNDARDEITLTVSDGDTGDDDGLSDGLISGIYGLGTPGGTSDKDGGDDTCFIAIANGKGDLTGIFAVLGFISVFILAGVMRSYRKLY